MPFRQRGSFGRSRRSGFTVVKSIKNVRSIVSAATVSTTTALDIYKAVNAPDNTVQTEVQHGCKVFRIWVDFTIEASAEVAIGTSNFADCYIIINPGANLTNPAPGSVGTSNEKKFVIRMWKGFIGARTQGADLLRFRGWIKIPKIYQRVATDTVCQFVFRSEGVASRACTLFIYKWFT